MQTVALRIHGKVSLLSPVLHNTATMAHTFGVMELDKGVFVLPHEIFAAIWDSIYKHKAKKENGIVATNRRFAPQEITKIIAGLPGNITHNCHRGQIEQFIKFLWGHNHVLLQIEELNSASKEEGINYIAHELYELIWTKHEMGTRDKKEKITILNDVFHYFLKIQDNDFNPKAFIQALFNLDSHPDFLYAQQFENGYFAHELWANLAFPISDDRTLTEGLRLLKTLFEKTRLKVEKDEQNIPGKALEIHAEFEKEALQKAKEYYKHFLQFKQKS